MKNSLKPAGIEPATFRFVAQHLNHCAIAVPRSSEVKLRIIVLFGHVGSVTNVREIVAEIRLGKSCR